jgi:diacylglycerol kinase family enzyme
MCSEYVFIVNPSSGGGKGEIVAHLLDKILPQHPAFCDGKGRVLLTRDVGSEQFHEIVGRAKAVIAVGGDGTAHYLIPHILKLSPPPALGLIPMGTSNDLARALGVSVSEDYAEEQTLRKTLDNLLEAQQSGLDVLSVNERLFFTNYFSVGFDAIIVRDFDDARKSWWARLLPRGRIANNFLYFLMGLKNAGFFIEPPLEIDFCDREGGNRVRIDSRVRAIIVSNLPVYAGGCRISRDARKDDGAFEITVIRSVCDYLTLIASRFLPFLRLPRGVAQYHARRATLRLHSVSPAQIDGEKCADIEESGTVLNISFHTSLRVLSVTPSM